MGSQVLNPSYALASENVAIDLSSGIVKVPIGDQMELCRGHSRIRFAALTDC